MPVFFLIAALAGSLTTASTVGNIKSGDAHRWQGPLALKQTAPVATFEASAYVSASDCLTAASLQHAALSACGDKM